MKNIENIIFDLGGVLFDIRYHETFSQLGKLLGIDLTVGQWPDKFSDLLFSYETGAITTETFIWNLQRMSIIGSPNPNHLVKTWNDMLIDWHNGVFDMLTELKNDYRLFLLSNINDLHYQYLERSLKDLGGIAFFNDLFVGSYYSHLIGYKKPDRSAFQLVIDQNAIRYEETLFIDDFPANVEAAIGLGMSSVCHNPHEKIKNKIKSYLTLARI